MALPNPFGSSALPKSSFTPIVSQKSQTLNPGPGLPQVIQPHYTTSNATRPQSSETRTYDFRRNNFQSSQYQPFSCDRCDRSFKTQELLNHHISEHIPCGINGCQFVAHPKIVERHIQMQHETGLAEQIMRLNTPEEIQKWREERKKRFPSSTNIALRQAEQKEKLERGEVLYEPKKKFAKGRSERGRGRGRGGAGTGWDARRNPNKRNNHHEGDVDGIHANSQQILSNSLPTLQTTQLKPSNTVTIKSVPIKKELSDGEIDSDNEEKAGTIPSVGGSNALANLMGYASDSTGEEETPDVKKAKIVQEEKTEVVEKVKQERPNKRRKKGKASGKSVAAPSSKELVRPKRLTLLQKLLQGEILHERNIIMQCVHYIVQQNYFGFGNGSPPTNGTADSTIVPPTADSCI